MGLRTPWQSHASVLTGSSAAAVLPGPAFTLGSAAHTGEALDVHMRRRQVKLIDTTVPGQGFALWATVGRCLSVNQILLTFAPSGAGFQTISHTSSSKPSKASTASITSSTVVSMAADQMHS